MYNAAALNAIKDFMVSHNKTLAVAESVTSGHLQAAFSLATDATRFFQGGITAYNLGQKARHLCIDPIKAEACNCVSETTASEMAINALHFFACDWAVGITGYAAPVPEIGVRDCFAFYAIASEDNVIWRGKIEAPPSDPYGVQLYFTEQLLEQFRQYLFKLA